MSAHKQKVWVVEQKKSGPYCTIWYAGDGFAMKHRAEDLREEMELQFKNWFFRVRRYVPEVK